MHVIHVEVCAVNRVPLNSSVSCPETKRATEYMSIDVFPVIITDVAPGAASSSQLHVALVAHTTTDQILVVLPLCRLQRAETGACDAPQILNRVAVLVADTRAALAHC